MIVTEARDARQRLRALQRTRHACAAAAAVDAIADFTNWKLPEQVVAQLLLIRRLGGLRSQGTTLVRVANAVQRQFGYAVSPSIQQADFMDAVRLASSGRGVVIGLAPPTGNGEGHAVRLRAGDVPNLGPFDGLPPDIRNRIFPPEVFDSMGKVQIFDPWPGQGRLSDVVQYGSLRRRFERAGQQVLVISPLPTKRRAR